MTRTTRRLLAGAIVALIPALAGCEAGLNAPTMAFHPPAVGAYATIGSVTINNAFVLGPAQGQPSLSAGGDAGLFLSLYSSGGDQLKSITTSAAKSVELSNGPVNIPANTSVNNMTGPSPKIILRDLSAPLAAGQNIWLTLSFAKAGPESIQVPVQAQAYAYATLKQPPPPAPSPTGTATASPTATASTTATHHHKKHHASATASATATASPTPSTTP